MTFVTALVMLLSAHSLMTESPVFLCWFVLATPRALPFSPAHRRCSEVLRSLLCRGPDAREGCQVSPAFCCDWAELDVRNRSVARPTGETERGTEIAEDTLTVGWEGGQSGNWVESKLWAWGPDLQAGGDCTVTLEGVLSGFSPQLLPTQVVSAFQSPPSLVPLMASPPLVQVLVCKEVK